MKTGRRWVVGRIVRVVLAATLLAPSVLRAGDFIYQFGEAFSGSTPVSTNPPWAIALFEDIAPGRVRLTVSNLTLTGAENIDELYFNLNPDRSATALGFTLTGGSGGFTAPHFQTGTDKFKAGGDGRYDIQFGFATGGSVATRFTAGDYLVGELYGIPSLTAADFEFLSLSGGGYGPYYAAAHVQRIGTASASGWLNSGNPEPYPVVPEPGPGVLVVFAAALWLGTIWLRKRTEPRRVPARVRARPSSHRSLRS